MYTSTAGEATEAPTKSSRRPSLNVNAKAFEPAQASGATANASDSNGASNVGRSGAPAKSGMFCGVKKNVFARKACVCGVGGGIRREGLMWISVRFSCNALEGHSDR